ncbi:hypothetical protein [Sorangium sp. So ce1182]|uniref:hypothetical protein n=1 Tax=Sorangium sp. So ce1182 TaxID=3133334 RepID=UPI003F5D95BA
MDSFSRWTMGVYGLGLSVALTGAAGCLGTAEGEDAALAEPIAAGAQALTGWQCAACVSGEYTHSVSLSQGSALGCANGEAYRCELIPWATRAAFTHCDASVACPPGWYVSGSQSGPSYCAGIYDRISCGAVPYPSGAYATCDPICYPGFTETVVNAGVPSCDYQDKRTCVK